MPKINKVNRDFSGVTEVETLQKGALVRKFRAGKPTKKLYEFDGYCRVNKAYCLIDYDDASSDSYLKKGTLVLAE